MGSFDDLIPGGSGQSSSGAFDDLIPKKSSLARRVLGDTGVSLLKGAVAVPEAAVGLADIVSGGLAGKYAEQAGFRPKEAKAALDEMYSPEQKAANQYVQEGDGFLDTIKRGIERPSVIGQSVAESLPLLLPGAAAARGIGAATKAAPYIAGAAGEGLVGAGSAAEQLRQGSEDGTISGKQTLGALASGVGTAGFGALGGKVASSAIGKKLGISDIDTVLAGGASNPANVGIAKRALSGAVSEGVLEELPQSMWEQAAQNYATDKPLGEGVGQAGAMGLLAGTAMGGTFNAMQRGEQRKAVDDTKPVAEEPPPAALGLTYQPNPAMHVFADGSTMTGAEYQQYQASQEKARLDGMIQPIPATPEQVKALGYMPGTPLVVFPDGTAMTRAEYEQDRANKEQGRLDSMIQPADPEPKLQETGPMSSAVNVGVDSGATSLRPQGSFSNMSEFANLLDQEQQDVQSRRTGIAHRQALQREVALQDADQRVADQMAKEAAQRRRAVLDQVLSDPTTQNPADRFAAELQRQGFRDSTPTADELATVQRFNDIKAAEPAGPEIEPSLPNELDAEQLGIKPKQSTKSGSAPQARDRVAEVRQLVADGWKISNKTLVSPTGKKRILNTAEHAAAKEATRERNLAAMEAYRQSKGKGTPASTTNVSSEETNAPEPAQMAAQTAQANDAQVESQPSAAPQAEGVAQPEQSEAAPAVAQSDVEDYGKRVVRRKKGNEARDDLVGAILRVTGGNGIAASMSQTITGDTANRASKVRGLFTNNGTMDLDDIANDLRTEEGYDVKDGNHLAELIREQAAGNPIYSMERNERDAAANEEKKRKDAVLKQANELGLKGVGGKRTLAVVEAEIAKVEAERNELEKRQERAAIQAEAIAEKLDSDGLDLTEADLMSWLGSIVEYTQDDINEANSRASEIASRRVEANAIVDSEGQAQSSGGERAKDGSTQEGARSNQGFDLTKQTNEQAAEQFAQQNAPESDQVSKEQADRERDAVPFSMQQQSQPKPQGRQTGLFTADGRVSSEAKQVEQTQAEDEERFEREMRASSSPTKSADDDVQTSSLRYVPFAKALEIARKAVASGVKPVPAQFHSRLDLTMSSADRLIAAVKEKPETKQELAKSVEAQSEAIEPAQPAAQIDTITASDKARAIGQENRIADFGEKIGGARKDRSQPLGPRNSTKEADERPAWIRKYHVMQVMESRFGNAADVGKWQIMQDTGSRGSVSPVSSKKFATEQEANDALPFVVVSKRHRVYSYKDRAGNPLFGIFRNITERKRGLVKGGFSSHDEAMKYLAAHPVEVIEHKFDYPERPWLDKIERIGTNRISGDVTTKMFQDTFGFRAGEFGNWNMGGDGQAALNHAYESLLDLADAIGVPPKAISLDGQLAIAFGARGTGGKRSAAAHYEPGSVVINLTKINGAGSLAHEWWHAVDHYFAKNGGRKDSDSVVAGGFSYKSESRPELIEAIKAVVDSMMYSESSQTTDAEIIKNRAKKRIDEAVNTIDYHNRDLRGWLTNGEYNRGKKTADKEQLAQWDAMVDRLKNGDMGDKVYIENPSKMRGAMGFETGSVLRDMNAIYKSVTGRSFLKQDPKSKGRQLQWTVDSIADNKSKLSVKEDETKTVKGRSSYYIEARRIDSEHTNDYWSSPEEMGARAFESYIYDKLVSQGGRSDYLVYGVENRYYSAMDMYPYPEGSERENIDKAFDNLFSTIQTKETDKGVAMFSRRTPFVAQYDEGYLPALNRAISLFKTGGRKYAQEAGNMPIPISRTPVVLRQVMEANGSKPFKRSDYVVGQGSTLYLKAENIHSKSDHGSKVGIDVLKNLPQLIADPVAVFKSSESGEDPDSYKILIDAKDENGKPVVVAIKPNVSVRTLGGENAHLQATIYPTSWSNVAAWNRAGDLRYYNEKSQAARVVGNNPRESGEVETPHTRLGFDASLGVNAASVKVVTKGEIESMPETSYSLAGANASRGQGNGMAFRDLQAVVDRISKGFNNLPKIHVLDSPHDLSDRRDNERTLKEQIEQAGAMDDVEGAHHNGEIYLFASGIASEERAEHVLATHEITHYGLRGTMGKGLDSALQNIWLHNKEIRSKATVLRTQLGLSSNVSAVEEVLAEMKDSDLVKLKGWRKMVQAFRDWAHKAGFDRIAAKLDGLITKGMREQEKADLFVANMVNAARDWVRNGKPARGYDPGTSMLGDANFSAKNDTINVDGVDRPTTNSDGRPIAQTKEGLRNFWRWFGDSKAVDAGGKPMMVYHGTGKDFNSFAPNNRGIYFVTPSADFANKYAGAEYSVDVGDSPNVMPVFVKTSNPFDFENKKHLNYLAAKASLGKSAIDQIKTGDWRRIEDRTTIAAIKSLGFDGVYVKENGSKNIGVFDSTQIKSAIGNNGNFDASNPDIRFSRNKSASVDASITEIFDGLAGRGLKKVRAEERLAEHPQAESIRYVQDNILDILEELEGAGTIKINC